MDPLVEMRGIRKEFPGVVANDNVNLEIYPNEVLGLLGENGAGKSTLMNILFGMYQPDAGEIFVRGVPAEFRSSRDAIDHGIGMVHQHFMLIPVHTVIENVLLGSQRDRKLLPKWQEQAQQLAETAARYGLPIDPMAKVGSLPLGMQQRVEVVKALYYGAELLILDEPTGVLTPQEVEELLFVMRQLAADNRAIVFITHKLDEVLAVTDRIVVLRNGRNAGEVRTQDTDTQELARMMVGREVLMRIDRRHAVGERPVLTMRDVSVEDELGHLALRNISISVREREILGIAGIDGNGQRELAEVIAGVRSASTGTIQFSEQDITSLSAMEIHRLGVGFIPEDRHTSGLFLDFTVEENLILELFRQPPYSHSGVLQPKAIRRNAMELIEEYSIRTSSPKTPARHLSGGNQQKIVLARALAHNPKLVIAAQPTRGLDIGATEYVRTRLIEQARQGSAILLISTELEEIMTLSDRIAVLFEGQLMGILERAEATRERIGLMMAGKRHYDLMPG